MNKISLNGRMASDVDYRDGEKPIARFTVAVNRIGKDEADFIRCVAFGKTAEFVCNYLKRGQEICVIGRLQINSYTDKDGNKTSSADVIVSSHEFCGKKED